MKILPIGASLLLGACASAPLPPLSATHPASPSAAEGARLEPRVSLQTDAATRQTRALLSAANREQERWNKEGPVSGTPPDETKPTPTP